MTKLLKRAVLHNRGELVVVANQNHPLKSGADGEGTADRPGGEANELGVTGINHEDSRLQTGLNAP